MSCKGAAVQQNNLTMKLSRNLFTSTCACGSALIVPGAAAFVSDVNDVRGIDRRINNRATATLKSQPDDTLSGLTPEGDFLIVGVNGDDPLQIDDNESKPVPEIPSTISATSAHFLSSTLGLGSSDAIGSSSPPSADNGDTNTRSDASIESRSNKFSGLNEDGDFLISGINDSDESSDENGQSSSVLGSPSFGGGLKLTSADDTIDLTAVARFKEQADASKHGSMTSRNEISNDCGETTDLLAEDDGAILVVEEWLLEIIPTLRESDSKMYARELFEIGFDPACISQCELTMEDLQFMKLLHRRYLFNEITGQGHPCEA